MDDNNKPGQQLDDDAAAQRELVRTDDNVPIYYELWDGQGEPFEKSWEELFEDIEPKPEENPKLYEVLFDINQKLNILINHISEKQGFNLPEAREVNISGSGLRFYCNDLFKENDKLVLKIFLPTYAHVIRVKCEVVRVVGRPGGGYDVGVRYIDMDESVREKIIRYIFAKQRKMLRYEKSTDE